ncbi:MAG: phosphonate C-P lyase system protein PhnH [Syntrophobacteraceae bacterium]|nr:phosphonate C-P lyase system protein PhnH [Syntrophobacteraceae bacterium]
MSLFRLDRQTLLTQQCYRQLLQALSRPGTLCMLPAGGMPDFERGSIPTAIALVMQTLCDERVTVGPCGTTAASWVADLTLYTGVRQAPVGCADYIVSDGVPTREILQTLKQGSLEAPEDSALVLVWLGSEIMGRDGVLDIRGPGVKDSTRVRVGRSLLQFAETRGSIPFEYPMGLDFLIIGKHGEILGLPRTSTLRVLMQGGS